MDVVNPIIRRWQQDAAADPDAFWDRAARELHWFRPWETTLEWTPPTFRWFVGGQTNAAYNCLDLHVGRGWGGHAALIGLDERGERRVFTYAQLLAGVEAIAAGLRGLGVGRGDRVAIYMPTMPETVMAMLACARIGAVHLVVFAGFGAGALADRMRLAGARVLLTADVTYRKGREIDLWAIAREALADPESPVERVVVLARGDDRAGAEPRARSLVGRLPRRRAGATDRPRGDGGQRPALRPRHLRHHRHAEAGRPHPRRLSGRHPQHGPLGHGSQTDRRLVVDRRHRLDGRPQLHRLRAAARRLHRRSPTRGRSTTRRRTPSTATSPSSG